MTIIASNSIRQQFATGVATVITTTNTICTSTDGFSKVADIVLAIFAYIKHTGQSISGALNTLGTSLEGFSELTGIISLVKRCKDWFVPDEKGKMMWQRAWQEMSGTVCSTVSSILSFIIYLANTLKVYSLGIALGPLSLINSTMSIGSSAFDIWDNAKNLQTVAIKTAKAIAEIEIWKREISMIDRENELSGSWINLVQKKKGIWTDRIKTFSISPDDKEKLAKAIIKKENWESLEKCSSSVAKKISERQVVVLKTQIHNHHIAGVKSKMTIALDVMFIALSVLSIIAAFALPGGLVLAMLLGGIVASVSDLSYFILDKNLK